MLIVPYEPVRRECVVVNSRFIASLAPADGVEEARAHIARVRAEFPDATHNVPAFVIGGGNSSTEFCSDDGEPSGTSGRPLLAVLKGSGMGNLVVVVTRYFGGTLLGTGGLVKAYTEAGRLVVEAARRAAMVETHRLELDLPYHFFDRLRIVAAECGAEIVAEDFAESVRLAVEVAGGDAERFQARLGEISSGSLRGRFVSKRMARRPL
ncbi:MAG: YigZ family protein [Spirochaetaceae bacterium]|nr:YigZ family protein [Spirochaetaceae bacterium]